MTINMSLYCKPLETVWEGRHSDRKSQPLVTLGMVPFGQVTDVWVIVLFSMAVSTQQLVASNRQLAKETFKVLMQSASDVTGAQVMER